MTFDKLIDIVPLFVLAFASYRITRFLLIDSLLDGSRSKLHVLLVNKSKKEGKLHLLWDKLYDLTSCTWCAGFWVSLAVYATVLWIAPWDFTRFDIVNVFAIAGLQGFGHAVEPGDE